MLAVIFDSRTLNIVGKEIASAITRLIWKLGFIVCAKYNLSLMSYSPL